MEKETEEIHGFDANGSPVVEIVEIEINHPFSPDDCACPIS